MLAGQIARVYCIPEINGHSKEPGTRYKNVPGIFWLFDRNETDRVRRGGGDSIRERSKLVELSLRQTKSYRPDSATPGTEGVFWKFLRPAPGARMAQNRSSTPMFIWPSRILADSEMIRSLVILFNRPIWKTFRRIGRTTAETKPFSNCYRGHPGSRHISRNGWQWCWWRRWDAVNLCQTPR